MKVRPSWEPPQPGEKITLKNDAGFAGKEVEREMLNTIIHARVRENFDLIKKQIEPEISLRMLGGGVVLTGGCSLMRGIKEVAESVFELPVHLGARHWRLRTKIGSQQSSVFDFDWIDQIRASPARRGGEARSDRLGSRKDRRHLSEERLKDRPVRLAIRMTETAIRTWKAPCQAKFLRLHRAQPPLFFPTSPNFASLFFPVNPTNPKCHDCLSKV